ncbi:methyltransferase [Algoriphagus sp. CAU 1675]|uniref:tRNA1(Val) (adenine(37)-N6)-methyltransferase n=1 Tax=Algoriphagus sp. CAU 1675 TaxID=3032597 RepID=UPI0023DAF190|nr:methyltransferase [Algoriphagus sp. CAU 1675]MDF2158820.1 methyltransferase [Algoriphagus sp. CAU 1675]
MGNSWFQFQQFRVEQDRCAMKISTDAVVLGALAKTDNPRRILDIGSGTGVIALMLAQRFHEAQITAVELDMEASAQAEENFKGSVFRNRLELWQGRIQDFKSSDSFDLIVSNPPYFPDHLKSSDPKRNQALHTDELPFGELIAQVDELLSEEGEFWLILPPRQMLDFENLAKDFGLFPSQQYRMQDSPNKPVHRIIASFSWKKQEIQAFNFFIKENSGEFTLFYKDLISGYLLGF